MCVFACRPYGSPLQTRCCSVLCLPLHCLRATHPASIDYVQILINRGHSDRQADSLAVHFGSLQSSPVQFSPGHPFNHWPAAPVCSSLFSTAAAVGVVDRSVANLFPCRSKCKPYRLLYGSSNSNSSRRSRQQEQTAKKAVFVSPKFLCID